MTHLHATDRAIYYQAHDAEHSVNGITPVGNETGISERLTAVSNEDDNTFLGSVPVDALEPLPDAGTQLEAGDLYAADDRAVMVRQSHIRTEHAVDDLVPTLFLVYRADVDGNAWIAGEPVEIGTVRTYEGVEYICIQAHVTQSGWTPPATPTLWAEYAEPSDEWQTGVSYSIGDVVLYEGAEYECVQAHTSQVGWEPDVAVSLWSAI